MILCESSVLFRSSTESRVTRADRIVRCPPLASRKTTPSRVMYVPPCFGTGFSVLIHYCPKPIFFIRVEENALLTATSFPMLVPGVLLVLLVLSATGASGGDPALFNSLDAGGPAWDALPMAGMADFAGAAATPGSYSSGIRGAPRAFDGFGGDRMLDRALGDRALGDSVSATNNEVPAALDTPVGPRPVDMRSRDPNNPLSKVPGLRDAEEREDYHGDEKAVSGTSEDAGWARRMGGSVGRRGWGVWRGRLWRCGRQRGKTGRGRPMRGRGLRGGGRGLT